MFADTAKVSLKAGKGGDGAVSFRHEIYVPKGGPDGGDGGRGGNIIFRADKDTNTLVDFRFTPILTAENGKNGAGQRAAGRSGKDLILEVPIGTVIYRLEPKKDVENAENDENFENTENAQNLPQNAENFQNSAQNPENSPKNRTKIEQNYQKILLADLTKDKQEAIIARGGDGGFGNAHFKSSTRQTPVVAEVGEPGEEFEALLELKSMADVGLVGLPNAGKSTFLSVVSNARPEIADYPFTTLTPQLGVATIDDQDILIADIPGLIEGAAEGRGLGHDFLRHVDRTAVLLHLVDVYNNDAGEAYRTIRRELEKYSDLASRPEIVALTKTESVDQDILEMQIASILTVSPDAKVLTISSSAHQGLTELLRELKTVINVEKLENRSISFEGRVRRREHISDEPRNDGREERSENDLSDSRGSLNGQEKEIKWTETLPTISLSPSALKNTWEVHKEGEKFVVTGEKIEKFARRTDLNNYASVNRLRDILKKLGIRAELTNQGAEPTSIISIASKEFTLVEQ